MRIYFCHNRIANIDDETFRGLIHLRILDLSNNEIFSITANSFLSLVRLTTLDVSSNLNIYFNNSSDRSEVTKHAFGITESDNYTTLNLAHCNIQSITLVYTLRLNVKELILYSNNIAIINKESFHHKFMMPVETIDLSSYFIRYVQPGSFLNLHNLKLINLTRNLITHLDLGVLNGLSNLEKVDVSFNLFSLFDLVILLNSPVKVLFLDNNKISLFILRSITSIYDKIQISIGGNDFVCEDLISILEHYKHSIKFYSMTPEFYTPNINGIVCLK